MTQRDKSDKSGSPEDDDFDFASFLEDSGEKKKSGPSPAGASKAEGAGTEGAEEDDFSALLEGDDEPTVRGGPPPSDTHDLGAVGEDDLATFLGEIPAAKDESAAKTSDDDSFASFLADEEKKGAPLPSPSGAASAPEMEGDDLDDLLKSSEADEGPLTESELNLLSEAPTKTLESYTAGRKADETHEMDAGGSSEGFALAEEDEETEVVMEPVGQGTPAAPTSSRSRLATVGSLALGLLLGGAGAYGGLSFLQVGPLKQELEEVKTQSVANRKKAEFLTEQRDGAVEQETQAKTALEASVKDLARAKAVAAKAVKDMQAAQKAQKAAQGAAAELQKTRDQLAQLKTELETAKGALAAAPAPAAPAAPAGADAETLAKLEATTKELDAARAQIEELTAEVKELSQNASAQKPAAPDPSATELAAAREKIDQLTARIQELESAPVAAPATAADEAPRAVANEDPAPDEGQDETNARLNQQLADAKAALAAANQELAKARAAGAGAGPESTSLYVGPKSNAEVTVALQSYHDGLHDFFLGDYGAALDAFGAAIERNPRDARYYYFRALAHRRQGNQEKAALDAKEGWMLERQEMPTTYEVSQALERIQGSDRFWLQAQRAQKPEG